MTKSAHFKAPLEKKYVMSIPHVVLIQLLRLLGLLHRSLLHLKYNNNIIKQYFNDTVIIRRLFPFITDKESFHIIISCCFAAIYLFGSSFMHTYYLFYYVFNWYLFTRKMLLKVRKLLYQREPWSWVFLARKMYDLGLDSSPIKPAGYTG